MSKRVAILMALLVCVVPVVRATDLSPFIDLQEPGLDFDQDGDGLRPDGTATLQVIVGGTVRAALLYWAGRDAACPEVAGDCVVPFQPYLDQQILFDGTPITGTLIGTESQPTLNINNIGYFADVTSLVSAGGTGLRTFSIADGNAALDFDVREGISLIVLYTDASDPTVYRVQLQDGLDFAWASDPDVGATRTTTAVTFNHGSQPGARAGQVFIFAGDGDLGLTDQLDISANPSRANTLNSSDGFAWDSEGYAITVPGGAASTTVQFLSNGATPDDFLWEVAVLRVAVLAASPTFQLSSTTYSAEEASGAATVTITRSSTTVAASVGLETSNGTATSPGDYGDVSTLIHFPAGVATVDVPISLVNDSLDEGNETFTVTLTVATVPFLVGTPSSAVVTITDTADAAAIPSLSMLGLMVLAMTLAIVGTLRVFR